MTEKVVVLLHMYIKPRCNNTTGSDHIIGINDTRLHNMINDSDIEIDGHEVMCWNRDRKGGGVASYVHKA